MYDLYTHTHDLDIHMWSTYIHTYILHIWQHMYSMIYMYIYTHDLYTFIVWSTYIQWSLYNLIYMYQEFSLINSIPYMYMCISQHLHAHPMQWIWIDNSNFKLYMHCTDTHIHCTHIVRASHCFFYKAYPYWLRTANNFRSHPHRTYANEFLAIHRKTNGSL